MSQSGAKSSAFQCPHCGGKFALPPDFKAQRVRCPHCSQAIALPPAATSPLEPTDRPTPSTTIAPPMPGTTLATLESTQAIEETSAAEVDADQAARLERAGQLLPPKFTARSQQLPTASGSEAAVLIPTAEGGFTPVAADLVRVSHRGREVTLRRARPTFLGTWLPAIVVLLCALLLVAAFFGLLRSPKN